MPVLMNFTNLFKLKFRREQHMLNFMYDVAQDKSNRKLTTKLSVRTRSSKNILLKVKLPRTEKYKKSLAYLGPKKWNDLSEDFHSMPSKASYKADRLSGRGWRGWQSWQSWRSWRSWWSWRSWRSWRSWQRFGRSQGSWHYI